MTTTRRIPVETTKDLGDAIVVRIEVGRSDTSVQRFHPGQPASTFAIGTSGAWKIVEVRPGRWTGDSVVFDDRARVQRHANHGCT